MRLFQRRPSQRPSLLAIVADTHPNSRGGLCHPAPIDLGDGAEYTPTKTQRWLYTCYGDFWQQARAVAREYDCEDVLGIHVGDGVDMNIKGKTRLIFPFRQSRAVAVAVDALQVGRDACDHWFMVRGTETHVGPDGDAEEQVGAALGAERDEQYNRWTWNHLRLYCSGVLVGSSHHPKTSSRRPWTKGAAANRQAAMNVYEFAQYDELDELPALSIYADRHIFEDSGYTHQVRKDGRDIGTRAVYCPSWQVGADDAFIGRIGEAENRPYIGGLLFVCFPNGDYIMKPPVRYFVERRKPWRKPT